MYDSLIFSIFRVVQSSTQSNFRNFCHPQKRLYTHYQLYYPYSSSLRQPLRSFCICRFFLLWTFHINILILYVVFDDWLLSLSMFSRFIHVIAYLSIYSFSLVNDVSLYMHHCYLFIYHLVGIWVVSIF